MKFRLRMLILAAVTVVIFCTYVMVLRPDHSDPSENVDNDYIDIPESRMDTWDLGPDPKWVRAIRASYNSTQATISQNEGRLRKRLTVSERVDKYISLYRPRWNYHLNETSPWTVAAKWVTSRQTVGVEAAEIGMNYSMLRTMADCTVGWSCCAIGWSLFHVSIDQSHNNQSLTFIKT